MELSKVSDRYDILFLNPPLVMNIVVTNANGDIYTFEVAQDLEVENLIVLIGVESGKSSDQIQVTVL